MFTPHSPRGTVYGVALNDPADLAALGEAVHQPPYKAPPQAPVLYLKPRNTWATSGDAIVVPAGVTALRMGAALGLVIGRSACHVDEGDALSHVAAVCVINDVAVPHASWYRPNVPNLARDGFCVIGDAVAFDGRLDLDALDYCVTIDDVDAQSGRTTGRVRSAARLIADLSDFMTLHPGDIVMTGLPFKPPQAKAGQRVVIRFDGVGQIENTLVAEGEA